MDGGHRRPTYKDTSSKLVLYSKFARNYGLILSALAFALVERRIKQPEGDAVLLSETVARNNRKAGTLQSSIILYC